MLPFWGRKREFLADASQKKLVGGELFDGAIVVDHSELDVLVETRKVEGE